MAFVALCIVGALCLLFNRVPKSYPPVANPIAPPSSSNSLGGDLDGFNSPYLGHTGSWDGHGGGMGGSTKTGDMDREVGMGLRWTFMPVYWRALEREGPVDLAGEIPPAWRALDAFIIEAHQRKLNVLMQAPVVGGNAGGPPDWAGRREKGKSAPADMDAAAAFAGKLAARYSPGGTLAVRQGWQRYGVRAWEMDNEPNGYLTHWKGQGADYAEFVTKVAAAIRKADPQAVIIGPAANIGRDSLAWIESALDPLSLRGSPAFRLQGQAYSIGPSLDVVSFHIYEGLDTAFSGKDRTIELAFNEIRDVFQRSEKRAPGFTYSRKEEYWQTEGNFDFLGILSRERRAAWRVQFLTRAFAAGIRKVMVMDCTRPEQISVGAYVRALPNPFPMKPSNDQVKIRSGDPVVFCHRDSTNADAGCVWVLWAAAGTGDAELQLPTLRKQVKAVQVDGTEQVLVGTDAYVNIHLRGDSKMAPTVLVSDRAVPVSP